MNQSRESTIILAFVPDLWNEPWQSRHYILSRLSEQYKVLWISRPLYWRDWLYNRKNKSNRKRIIKVSKSFWCYAPSVPADYVPSSQYSRIPTFVRRLYHHAWLFVQILEIKIFLKRFKAQKVILYLWQPYYYEQIGRFNEKMVCYHIDDEYHYDSKTDNPISEQERMIMEKSDVVFIHSKTLLEKKGNINKNTFYIPNGVEYELYRNTIKNTAQLPDDILNIRKPIIGYAGWIKKHLDLKLLLKIAMARRDWTIILIGPVQWKHNEIREDIDLLRKESNVVFLGYKKLKEMPIYINSMDVCLMPYRVTLYTKYIFPLKLHEYLACGKPIVATRLPNLEEFSSLIYLAESYHQWIQYIENALNEKNEKIKAKRIKTARKNSWGNQVKNIRTIINQRI